MKNDNFSLVFLQHSWHPGLYCAHIRNLVTTYCERGWVDEHTRVQCVCVWGVYAHAHAGYHQTLAHSKNSIDVISLDIYLV